MDNVVHEVIKLKGIVTDIPPAELVDEPVWTSGRNVHFDDRSTHRCGGYLQFADPLPADTVPIFLQPVLTPATAYWIWVGESTVDQSKKIYVTDGTNHFDITPAAGVSNQAIAGEWTGTLLNNIPVINNRFDVPVWWDGNTANIMQPLPGWDANWRARSIRAFKYHLVAMWMTENSVEFPEKVRWSKSTDPGQIPSGTDAWTAEPGNDAGDNILAEELGGVVDGAPLHGQFIIYRSFSTAVMNYVGGQFVFAFREVFPTHGVQGLNCIAESNGKHWVFADDDIIVHDGNSMTSIIDQKNRNLVFGAFGEDNRQLCQVAGRTATDELWFIVPDSDQFLQRTALVYSMTEDTWGIRSLPDTYYVASGIIPNEAPDPTWDGSPYGPWNQDPRIWNASNYSISNDQMLMASTEQKLYHADAINSDNGADTVAFIERLYQIIGAGNNDIGGGRGQVAPMQNKGDMGVWQNYLIRSVYPRFTGSPGDTVQVRVAATRGTSSPINWSAPKTMVIGEGSSKVDIMVHGRYLHLKVESTGGDPWQLHRIGIEYVPLSKY